jgi:hypothetical protein
VYAVYAKNKLFAHTQFIGGTRRACLLIVYVNDIVWVLFHIYLFIQILFVTLQRKLKERSIDMARPIRETPVLKGEDAFNFEWRRAMVENRTSEERAEAHRKFMEELAEADKLINVCF